MNKFINNRFEELLEIAKQYGLSKPSLSDSAATNWVVFTGTYSSGKTTLIQDIANFLDVRSCQEPARTFIAKQLLIGHTKAEIWANVKTTVMPVHKLRVDLECSLDTKEFILLDTAIPDTLPYALLYGIDPNNIIKESTHFRYKEMVFLLEPLPFKPDEIRNQNPQERIALHYLRKNIYTILGYHVISVPVLDRIERRDFVLRYLREMPEVQFRQ